MLALTPSSLGVMVQDALALGVLTARRAMADQKPSNELSVLRGEIIDRGSSFAAFRLCLDCDPESFEKLLHVAGVSELTGQQRVKAFDACADGYSVYHDGRRRGKL